MKFSQIYSRGEKVLSFEFFPPKQEAGLDAAKSQMRRLVKCRPHFVTVTYGAGGGTRQYTRDLVSFASNELKRDSAAHLTCVGHSAAEIDRVLDDLKGEGISAVLALRGDPPEKGGKFTPTPGGFHNARDLTAHIHKRGGFSIAVAGYPEGHPEAATLQEGIEYLKQKVDAGAEAVLTQLFFRNEAYYDFQEQAAAAGITVPLVPGIMPIGSISQVKRFTTMCGATIPGALLQSLGRFEDDPEGLTQFGIDYAVAQCRDLLARGAPGIHLYTLNKSAQAEPIVRELGWCPEENSD